jgi:hypothetical protein
MNGINTLDIPTINGLKNLQLDQIDTSILNADTIILENVQTSNLIVSDEIIFLAGSSIVAGSSTISDIEISYLDGVTSNIQIQIDSINTEIDTIDDTLISLQDQIYIIPGPTDLTTLNNKTQNQSATSGETIFSGDMRLTNLFFASNPYQYQDVAFTSSEKTKLSWLSIDATELLINQIRFIDDVGTSAVQRTAFTSFLRTLIFSNSGNISTLQDKTANITRGGTITNISGALTTPIVSIGTQINFPDTSVQTTAYIPTSPTLTQYSGDALICLGQVINNAGTWYNFNYTWQPTALFLTPGMYTINLTMTLGKINELQRIESYMFITRFGATVEESFESGIYLQSATGQREKYNYNLQFIYKSEHSTNLLNVYTAIHMKASSLSYFLGKVQILKH